MICLKPKSKALQSNVHLQKMKHFSKATQLFSVPSNGFFSLLLVKGERASHVKN